MSGRQNLVQELWRNTRGSALVEATVLTPLLIVLFFGLFEFSWYFYNQQLVEIGIRDAARYLARGPYVSAFLSEGDNPCGGATAATRNAAAANLAVFGNINGSGSARVKSWQAADVSVSCNNPAPIDNTSYTYAGPTTIYFVTVTTSFDDPQLGYLGLLGLGVPKLSASHTERFFGSG